MSKSRSEISQIVFEKVATLLVEALERGTKSWPLPQPPIRDLDFPRSAIIGGVIRDGVGKIALGDFVIKKGDRILVCALYNAISKVEKLFL